MKTTSRDIWSIPPGGLAEKRSRNWIRPTIASALVLSLGVGGGAIYASMKKSTAVTTDDALAQFRSQAGNPAESSKNEGTANSTKAKANKPARASKRQSRQEGNGSGGAVAAAPDAGGGSAGTSSEQQSSQAATGGGGTTKSSASARPVVPEEGVYTWNVEGVERGPGVERRLPRRSHRIITHKGNDRWEEHHIFSEQKELWFQLGTDRDQGVYCSAARNKVTMGPVTIDRTVTFDPVMFVSQFPMKESQTWEGRWDGKTRGSYSGKTIDHGTLTIDGKSVEVYVTEVVMQMTGEVEGRVVTRSWVAPDYSMVVKQYQESDVESGPGSYYSEWEGQVASLTPQR